MTEEEEKELLEHVRHMRQKHDALEEKITTPEEPTPEEPTPEEPTPEEPTPEEPTPEEPTPEEPTEPEFDGTNVQKKDKKKWRLAF